MAVSKRLRFEILRRDNHTCCYCGRSAPDVVLHVDHVMPKALGGSDTDPANLKTSCVDCNAGKGSSAPDQTLVDEAKIVAAKWTAAMEQAALEAVEQTHAQNEREPIYSDVLYSWPRYYHDRIPDDFTDSVDQFLNAGLPPEVIIDMAKLAATKPGIYKRWSYFCGCCWTKVRQLQERAAQILAESGDE